MHVLGAVADDDTVDDVGVVPRFGEVVGELDAVVRPLEQMSRGPGTIRRPRPTRDGLGEQRRLA